MLGAHALMPEGPSNLSSLHALWFGVPGNSRRHILLLCICQQLMHAGMHLSLAQSQSLDRCPMRTRTPRLLSSRMLPMVTAGAL